MPPGSYMSPLSPDNAIFSPNSGVPQLSTSRSLKAQLHEVKIVQVCFCYDVKLCRNLVGFSADNGCGEVACYVIAHCIFYSRLLSLAVSGLSICIFIDGHARF